LDVVGNGKTKVIKHGTKEITRDGFEYELTVNFELINDKHLAKASKDRTSLFTDKPEFIVNTDTGRELLEWCTESNEDRLRIALNEIERCETVDGLKHIYQKNIDLKSEIVPKLQIKKQKIESLKNQIVESKNID
jgi:hypothetical protein